MMTETAMRDEETEFRFGSKREYEEKIKRILALKNSLTPRRRRDAESLDEEYDLLVEEYLRFCAVDNGQ